jgi:hypothetical protein
VDVREESAKGLAKITNSDGLQISSLLFVHKEKAMGSRMIADPPVLMCRQPPLVPGDSTPMYARTSQDCGSSTA